MASIRSCSSWLLSLALLAAVGCAGMPAQPARSAASVQAASTPTFTGDIRHHPQFASHFLSDRRDLWVYLPPGYRTDSARRYPVLYMHDGNNLFDAHQSFAGVEWGMDETAQRLIVQGEVPPFIIVGISNTPARMDEYTWVRGSYQGQPTGGKGSLYGRFLVEELKPFIDRTYRTQPDRLHTGVMGSSLGGLISVYLARNYGEVFGMVGVMSPSVFWAQRAVLRDVAGIRTDSRVYLDIGTEESGDSQDDVETAADAEALRDVLVGQGYRLDRNLLFVEEPGGHHNEAAWARRAPAALKFLLSN